MKGKGGEGKRTKSYDEEKEKEKGKEKEKLRALPVKSITHSLFSALAMAALNSALVARAVAILSIYDTGVLIIYELLFSKP